jgi:predicted transcriptional regulator
MLQNLPEMAKDLVLAQIKVHRLSPEDMHAALQDIYTTLLALHAKEASRGRGGVATPQRPPAPSNWRKSIAKHTVTCLVCAARFKQLSTHHLRAHGLDARSYRLTYGIPPRQPLSARAVTARRKQIVQQSRPWEKAPTYLKAHGKVETQAKQPVVKKTRQERKKGALRVKK